MGEKQRAVNKWFVFWTLMSVGTVLFGSAFINSEERSLGIFGFVAGVFFFIVALVAEPVFYVFDSESVSLIYAFRKKECYLWKNVRSIRESYRSVGTGHTLSIPTPSEKVFLLDAKVEGEEKWYTQGYVRKSFRTEKLMEKYWGVVEESDFSKFKKKIEKWQGKKRKQIDAHFTDEAVRCERESRAKIRDITKPVIEKAKNHNIDIKVKFFYVTSSGEELTSRPDEGYRYTACAEISYIGETDEDRIVVTDEDLLFVRFSKTGYKCTENKKSAESFKDTLEEVTATIREKGIEFYCN